MIRRTHHAAGNQHNEELRSARDFLLRPGEEPPLASHLVSPRALYTHHGIYVGDGRVIHYSGLAYGLRRGPVEEIPLARFAHGHEIGIRSDRRLFDRCEVVDRARSRLGERRYRILTNNCAHLCAWALRDENRGAQVKRIHVVVRAVYRAICTQYQSIDRHRRAIVRAFRFCWFHSGHTQQTTR